MRTIKFRGKRVVDGEWVYGYVVEISFCHNKIATIQSASFDFVGKERAIVMRWTSPIIQLNETQDADWFMNAVEVIGNIHDNPELLK